MEHIATHPFADGYSDQYLKKLASFKSFLKFNTLCETGIRMTEKLRQVKVCVMGKGVCGKDCLVERLLQNQQHAEQMVTMYPQLSFSTKKTVPSLNVQWMFYSFSGSERFEGWGQNFLRKTDAVLLCVKVNYPTESTDVSWIPTQISKIRELTNAPIFLVQTMCDMESFHEYPELPPDLEELKILGKTSAKTGQGCDTLLERILAALPEPAPQPESPKFSFFDWLLSLFKF